MTYDITKASKEELEQSLQRMLTGSGVVIPVSKEHQFSNSFFSIEDFESYLNESIND